MTDTTQTPEPIWQDAISLCRDLQSGVTTAVAIMENVYARINALNPKFNAIVNLLDYDQAMALARQADAVSVADRGILHGLPMALKDAVAMQGFPTTWGFKPFASRIETTDDGLATRLREAGAIFIGHTNMPEFGFGSSTFNSLFGTTLNPYDTSKTAGGSSGGAESMVERRALRASSNSARPTVPVLRNSRSSGSSRFSQCSWQCGWQPPKLRMCCFCGRRAFSRSALLTIDSKPMGPRVLFGQGASP